MAESAMKKRWHERCLKSHATCVAEKEQRMEMKEKQRVLLEERRREEALKQVHHEHAVEQVEHSYNALVQCDISDKSVTSPLLLNEVITPVCEPSCTCETSNALDKVHCNELLRDARRDRDKALCLARQYRDLAEASRTESREIKNELERKI